jgi:hypothetical protein
MKFRICCYIQIHGSLGDAPPPQHKRVPPFYWAFSIWQGALPIQDVWRMEGKYESSPKAHGPATCRV